MSERVCQGALASHRGTLTPSCLYRSPSSSERQNAFIKPPKSLFPLRRLLKGAQAQSQVSQGGGMMFAPHFDLPLHSNDLGRKLSAGREILLLTPPFNFSGFWIWICE
ncbi:hypothetical protein CEXT_586161 [Caerostris extrusa]|uniref:Uncharacterized protein n=1 Tax=Caerostris extrusa TaxID=172846 RepID=A0AAV4QMN9_CAEEX|nr:hypothetical protein CEXT_586161 [Caerostris extrusa]